MRVGRATAGLGVAGLTMAALFLVGARQPTVIVVDGLASGPNAMPECPHSWPFRGVAGTPFFSGERTDVPEFHDCQRLRDGQGQYGALAAVFARDSLEAISDQALAAHAGVAVALVHLPNDPDPDFAHTYPRLGLTKPFACVMVRRAPGRNAAWIVPVDHYSRCSEPVPPAAVPGLGPFDLHVLPSPVANLQPPPVARWDWDATTRTQYIGVRCGTAWCEIGVQGFRSSPGYDPGAIAGAARAGFALRGAYDEQRLAEFPSTGLTAGANLGTVVPMPAVQRLAQSRPVAGTWVPVAKTFLSPRTGSYTEKFNFAATGSVSPTDQRASTVQLCVSTATSPCRAREPNTTLDVSGCSVVSGTADERWISRVDRPGGGTRYYCVVYRAHPVSFRIPPVVRWRWRADDETIWISCPSGCCEVKAKT